MEYTEKSRRNTEDTTFTLVEYNIEGTIVEVDIAHFQPQVEEDITRGILNRYITERRKLFPELDGQLNKQVEDYTNGI